MEQARFQQVTRGRMHVATGRAALRTIVGNGYAVCVSTAHGAGGLVHLESKNELVGDCCVPEASWAVLKEFVARLSVLGPLAGARAELIGGADVLKLLPMARHQLLSDSWVTALSEFLLEYSISVRRVVVQGSLPRRVCLRLPEGEVQISAAGTADGNLVTRRPVVSGPRSVGLIDAPEEGAAASGTFRSVTVNLGCMCVDRSPTRLITLLGSCVGVALYDPGTRTGGLAHVMLPRNAGREGDHSRYADTAVPALVEALTRAGACRSRLGAKIAGGASVMFHKELNPFGRIAQDNIELVRKALREADIPLLGEDVGGQVGRKMIVDLGTFGVRVMPLTRRVE